MGGEPRIPGLPIALAACALIALGGCQLAPPYNPPRYSLPQTYQGSGLFTVAHPRDTLPRGPWWEGFDDPLLNKLERQLDSENPSLAAYAEQYTQARDLAAIARSRLYPQVSASAGVSKNRESKNELFRNPNSTAPLIEPEALFGAGATWEPDFWSQLRNTLRQQERLAQSSAALVASARLSLEGQLANDYIALRGFDAQDAIYREAVANYQTSVRITTLRLRGKIGSGLDLARAQSLLQSTQALESATLATRAVLQHAIAVLCGENPSTFVIPVDARMPFTAPAVPFGAPSQLLERRPDIASAERQMAAANAGIGVARAAFFPNITISAAGGFEDTGFFDLATLPNTFWSVGASVVEPIFEGGLRRAQLQQSWAVYAQTRDTYRATVLAAFQEVEDGLAQTALLQRQTEYQQGSVAESVRAQNLALQLYVGGLTSYVDVVVAQETALVAGITAAQDQVARLQASVNLILALGGGWNTADLPTEKGVLPFSPLDLTANPRQPRPDGTGNGPVPTPPPE
ncbi:MAG TPA: efflux transporter outer membrane subunit [Caulobacteraceae bacterium]|jgi:NodT family efflux transporter outer membrane factor (OMF) lipoprotein